MPNPDLHYTQPKEYPVTQEKLEAAAEWFAQLRDGEADEKVIENWRLWLQEHDDHQSAWDYVISVGQRFSFFQSGEEGKAAISVLQDLQTQRFSRRKALRTIFGIAATGLTGWAIYSRTPLTNMVAAWQADESTATGEIRELRSIAGSRIWLNTATAINTHTQNNSQQIELIQGEVLVATTKHSTQPIHVSTEHGQLKPLGTEFTVRKLAEGTLLAVYKGIVEIQTTNNERKQIQAGRQVIFSSSNIAKTETANPLHKSWSRGVLLAENITLGELVSELSRYQHGHISVASEVADLRVIGGYPLDDIDQTLSMLGDVLPIQIHRPMPWWITIKGLP